MKAFISRIVLFLMLFSFSVNVLWGQEKKLTIGIDQVIYYALARSLPSQTNVQSLRRSQLEFALFQTALLPTVNLKSIPISFNRTIVQRYDVNEAADIYVTQQNIYSFLNLELTKPLGATGGRIFVNANVGRLQNLGENPFINFSTSPINIGLSQPIGGFNPYKWEKLQAPIRLQAAERRNILVQEQISRDAVGLYFDLLIAQQSMALSLQNMRLLDTLLEISKKRNLLGGVPQDQLLQLELQILESETDYERQRNQVGILKNRLINFLQLSATTKMDLEVPSFLEMPQIPVQQALKYCMTNHPNITDQELLLLDATKAYEKQYKESRFQANLDASIGLNQSDSTFASSLQNPLDQEVVFFSFDIPLVDWGRRKQALEIAEAAKIQQEFELQNQKFNLQTELQAELSKREFFYQQNERLEKMALLAAEQLKISQRQYLSGKIDLLTLSLARSKNNQIQRSKIDLLREYWLWMYNLRSLTLYDFRLDQPIAPYDDF
ncbi:MAG: TolC family protein [Bacteroidota bacterium]